MNVTPTGGTNAANRSLFMVNVAYFLRTESHPRDADYSVLDLKADCRGYNPTASFIFDMRVATSYASPTYPIYPKETAYVTSLSDRRRRICHSHV